MPKRRGRDFTTKRPRAKRPRAVEVGRALVTQKRVFVSRPYGNPMARSEAKYFDKELGGTTVIDAGTVASWAGSELDPATTNCLFAPVQGNDFNNREGRQCHLKKIKIRFTINFNPIANLTSGVPGQLLRLIVYQDMQTNASFAQGEDVIDSGVTATQPVVQEFQNVKNFGRFRVLMDKIIQRPPTGSSFDGTNIEGNGHVRFLKWTKVFKKPITVHFNATNGGTVADIIDHSFHVIGAAFSGTPNVQVYYKSRCVFCE